jgi:hypothetical protein
LFLISVSLLFWGGPEKFWGGPGPPGPPLCYALASSPCKINLAETESSNRPSRGTAGKLIFLNYIYLFL